MSTSAPTPMTLAGLAALAALYFSLTCTVTLEWNDEGQFIHDAWRVAEGGVPHRDFRHIYGPGAFVLNGLLLRLFGNDLLIIRGSLVVLKTVATVLAYLAARRICSPPFALLAFVSTVVVWGGPWWVFNAPYAGHYALTLCLIGVLAFLRIGGPAGGLVAGLCCGLAALFKQTTALFVVAALALIIVWDATSALRTNAPVAPRWTQALRALVLLGVAAFFLVYLGAKGGLRNLLILSGPFLISAGWILTREVRGGAHAAAGSFSVLCAVAAGMVVPLALCVAVYATMGLLDDLVTNTLTELPQVVRWFIPIPPVSRSAAALSVGVALALVALKRVAQQPAPALAMAGVGLGTVGFATTGFVGPQPLASYLQSGSWIGDVFSLVYLIPFAAVYLALCSLMVSDARRVRGAPVGGAQPLQTIRAQWLLTLFAATGLLNLYPGADFWHLVMAWPAFAAVIAWQAERLCRTDTRVAGWTAAALAGVVLVCAAPFVHAVVTARGNRPEPAHLFARASRINDGSQKASDAAALVHYLEGQSADRRLLSVGEGALLYFLAGRRSVHEPDEFVLYLVHNGIIDDAAAHRLISEAQTIARLSVAQPIIVMTDHSEATQRFRSTFADVAAYIDAHYRTVAQFGMYRVLMWGAA